VWEGPRGGVGNDRFGAGTGGGALNPSLHTDNDVNNNSNNNDVYNNVDDNDCFDDVVEAWKSKIIICYLFGFG